MNLQEYVHYTGNIGGICDRYFTPAKNLADGKPNPGDSHAMRAEALSATACMTTIATIFKGIETGEPVYTLPAIVALSFGLSENQFWKQYSVTLVPAFKTALHASLMANSIKDQPEMRSIYLTQRSQWHNLFVIAYDCMYGIEKTVGVSVMLLQELSKVI